MFEIGNLLEQLFSFVRIFDTHTLAGKVLKEGAVHDIRTGENGLLTALKRLMLNELDAMTVIDKRVACDTCFLLIRLGETSVDDEALTVRPHGCLAFDRTNRHMAVDDTSGGRIEPKLREYLFADLLVVSKAEIRPFLLLVRGLVRDEIALEGGHLILVVERRMGAFPEVKQVV